MPHGSSHRQPTGRPAAPTPVRSPTYVFDREAARALDRCAQEEFAIPSLLLMENAALSLRQAVNETLTESAGRAVMIACGGGNNGGDGWALVRHLHNDGHDVAVIEIAEPRPGLDASINRSIALAMGISVHDLHGLDVVEADVIVDGIFGTGLTRPVEGAARQAIDWINSSGRTVLAIDIPSGLDCDTGEPLGEAVKATRTVSFVGYKQGFLELPAQRYIGVVTIGDIGAPRGLAARFGRPMQNPADRRPGSDAATPS